MSVSTVDYQELDSSVNTDKSLIDPQDFSLISDIQIELDVVIGRKKISVAELYQLKPGEVLQLDDEVTSVVNVYLNGNIVAKGNLVVVDDNYGVQITESINV